MTHFVVIKLTILYLVYCFYFFNTGRMLILLKCFTLRLHVIIRFLMNQKPKYIVVLISSPH